MSVNETPATPKKESTRVNIDLPKDLQAIYANIAFISNTPAEVVIDFAQILPRTPRGAVQARVVMTPMHAKMLQQALSQSIANYERQFGEIRLPHPRPNLAEDFFKFPPDAPNGDENGNGK